MLLWPPTDRYWCPVSRVAEKAGATFEGILRSRLKLGDKNIDAAMFSLLPEDLQYADILLMKSCIFARSLLCRYRGELLQFLRSIVPDQTILQVCRLFWQNYGL